MRFFFLIFMLFNGFVYSQKNENKIMQLVDDNIVPFLEKIPKDQEYLYGFNQRSEFSKCISERPIQLLTLNDKNILVKQLIWRVPVSLNGINKILFTVVFNNDRFQIVDIGGVKLAKEFQKYQKSNRLFLLRLYSNSIDFITDSAMENTDSMKFTPLQSAQSFLERKNIQKKNSFNINEILSLIK